MRNLDELNVNEGGRPVTRNQPTAAELSDFQSHFGISLPDDYVFFLRHSNGGHPERNAFRPKGLIEDVLWGVSRFYFLNDDRDDLEGLWGASKAWRGALHRNIVPIADDDGGNQILLLFDRKPPSVELCIHDEGMRLVHVADSFGEFIDMLTEDPDMI
ncbi:MAG: SMI1/KNR4 family protein [Gemmataceae bacterium]